MKKIIRIVLIVSSISAVSACCTLDWGTACTTSCCSNANRCCGASSWF